MTKLFRLNLMLKNPPPLQKTAYELSIYVCFKTLILSEQTTTRPFHYIHLAAGKAPKISNHQQCFAGNSGLLSRQTSLCQLLLVSYKETVYEVAFSSLKTKRYFLSCETGSNDGNTDLTLFILEKEEDSEIFRILFSTASNLLYISAFNNSTDMALNCL